MPRFANPNRKPHPKDPKGFSISARFPVALFKKIEKIAKKDRRSLNYVTNSLVAKGLLSGLDLPPTQAKRRPKDHPAPVSVSVRFRADVFAEIHKVCLDEERSLNYAINGLVRLGLDAEP